MSHSAVPPFMREVVREVPAASPADVGLASALALNSAKDSIYAHALAAYQKNLLDSCPVILGLFTSQGGQFTLYRPGHEPLEAPRVPIQYEATKSVGHSAIATYQLLARYTGDPTTRAWHGPMRAYREQMQQALDSCDDWGLPDEGLGAVRHILSTNLDFMTQCLDSGEFTPETLTVYAQSLKPSIQAAIGYAAGLQVSHWMSVMDEWRALIGDEAWPRTYGVSNCLYVARPNNILFTVMAQYFGQEAFNDRLLLLETTEFSTTHEAMLDLLTRIVSDRVLGQVFFKDYFLMDSELLSTGARDAIAAGVAERASSADPSGLSQVAAEASSRGMEPLLAPLAPFRTWEWPWRTRTDTGVGPTTLAETDASPDPLTGA
ncbi:MAG: hypothetical protein Q8M17_10010 [Actinomycetota bacterium]|nr:hypothetical protein [Actinomycetota bacterium]